MRIIIAVISTVLAALLGLASLQGDDVWAAQRDVFLTAVGFALTGRDGISVEAFDRSNCVFGFVFDDSGVMRSRGRDLYYLNSVQLDRITIQWGTTRTALLGETPWTEVELHGGASPVHKIETTTEAVSDADFQRFVSRKTEDERRLWEGLRKATPSPSRPSQDVKNEYEITLRLKTGEHERVTRAWQYIYSNGCVGTKSPF
jgi:hypothetical protein